MEDAGRDGGSGGRTAEEDPSRARAGGWRCWEPLGTKDGSERARCSREGSEAAAVRGMLRELRAPGMGTGTGMERGRECAGKAVAVGEQKHSWSGTKG